MASKDEKKPTIDSVRDDINKVQNQIIQLSEHQKKLLSDLRVVEQEFEYDIYRNMVGKFLTYTDYDDGVENFTDYTYVNGFCEENKIVSGVSVIFNKLEGDSIEQFNLPIEEADNLENYTSCSKKLFMQKYVQVLNGIDNVLHKKRSVIVDKKLS